MKFLNKKVWAWALWDMGTSAISAVVITFVFAPYLTSSLFPPNSGEVLGWVLAAVGIIVAAAAPAIGLSSDRSGYHGSWIRAITGMTIILVFCLYFVKPGYLMLGIVLLAFLSLLNEIGQVHYNSLLPLMVPKEGTSSVSAFGWGLGYLGSIFALAAVLFGFILPETRFSLIQDVYGIPIRAAMLFIGVWVAVWCIPLLVVAKDRNVIAEVKNPPFYLLYLELFKSIRNLWREHRGVVLFVIASAFFRDGLNGVFAFAGVLGQGAFGFKADEIVVFAIVSNLVAGVVTIASGWADTKIGSLNIIKISILSLIALGVCMFMFHDVGKPLYWGLGLAMSALVGPAQSSSRTFLTQIIPEGREAEIFGLYATTGRAASFLSPAMWSTFLVIGRKLNGEQPSLHYGILGVCLVLFFGFIAMQIMEHQLKKVK